VGTLESVKCFECRGVCHLARECPTRLSRQNSRNPPKGNSASPQQQKAPPGQQRIKARKNEQASGQGSSSFHISVPRMLPNIIW
jgi:hypothetical protein